MPVDGLRYAPSCIYGGLRSDIVAVDGKDNGRNWPSRCGELSSKDAAKAHQCILSLHCWFGTTAMLRVLQSIGKACFFRDVIGVGGMPVFQDTA